MAPFCKDEEKYEVVENLLKKIIELKNNKTKIDDQIITEILTVNGIRFSFKDGSWGLIRASNTTPKLVLRFEANTPSRLKEIKNMFLNQLKLIDETIHIDIS